MLALEWAWRIADEFFRQGDREADLSLPISPFMDRRKDSLARTIVVDSRGECPDGFAFQREGSGWRCYGGTHFVKYLPEDECVRVRVV